jgi:hypothetical protein
MKLNLSHILEGWRNHLLPPAKLREVIEQTSNERLEICRACEHNSEVIRSNGKTPTQNWRKDEHCDICACPLMQKTKALHSFCPLNPPKWGPVATDSQSMEINQALEDAEKHPDK